MSLRVVLVILFIVSSARSRVMGEEASSLWFPVGEVLEYTVRWGVFSVGQGVVTSEWTEDEQGRRLIRIQFDTRSNRVIAMLYPVKDLQWVLIDPGTFLPVEVYKDSRQGRFKAHERITFDHARGLARHESFIEKNVREVPIDPETRDLVTYMYWTRSQPLAPGDHLSSRVYADDGVHDLSIAVTAREDIELDGLGKVVPSLKFEPEADFEGLFVRRDKMLIWVSDDERRVCTRIATKVPVGSVVIELVAVSGPGDDGWVQESVRLEDAVPR
ncbi:MAG TPA: DUF3108 domain-containing protein [Kiritimatiellia bacterium]|nr:DUF3108 domain-containing protein [Kiritimatiellia bacterium]